MGHVAWGGRTASRAHAEREQAGPSGFGWYIGRKRLKPAAYRSAVGSDIGCGASEAELHPHKIDGTMAFRIENRWVFHRTDYALVGSALDEDHDAVRSGFPKAGVSAGGASGCDNAR